MTRMTGPDCVVMCNLINTYIHAYIHTYIYTYIDIHKGGEEAHETAQELQTPCGNGGDLGGKRKTRRHERVGSVAANPDDLENSKKAGGEGQRFQGLSKNCTNKESVPRCRV